MLRYATGSCCAHAALWMQLVIALGCSPGTPPPPALETLASFGIETVPGVLSHDLVLTNNNHRSLEQIDLTVTVYFEDSDTKLVRHWAYWRHGEDQTVNVLAGTPPIQRVEIKGTAVAGVEKEVVEISALWLYSYDQRRP